MKRIPLHCLVILVGPTGSGKTSLAHEKFPAYEILSADKIREELTGDAERFDINDITFREIHRRMHIKLELGERVVIDAVNVRRKDRVALADAGKKLGVSVYYLVVNRPLLEILEGYDPAKHEAITKQYELFSSNERDILRGDHIANVVDSRTEAFEAVRKLNPNDLINDIKDRGFQGIMAVGDVHGVAESMKNALDWSIQRNLFTMFLGDIVDYGPDPLECVDRVYDQVVRGKAAMIVGNHERKIERWLEQSKRGEIRVRLSEGNRVTTRAIEALSFEQRKRFEFKFKALLGFSRHHWLVGDTMFVHGSAEPEMFNINTPRLTGKHETSALFGEVDNSVQRADGFPNRVYNWVNRIPAGRQVIVGHDIRSTVKPLVSEGTAGGAAIFMDTGCGKGGRLTTADLLFEGDKLVLKCFTSH